MWVDLTRAGCCVVALGGSEKSRLVTASANARSYVQQCNNFENRLRFDKVRDLGLEKHPSNVTVQPVFQSVYRVAVDDICW